MEFVQKYWLFGLGFFAQGLFGVRLLIQLILSEKAGRSISPVIFWQLSLLASFLFLTYGILRQDVVIILGQTFSYYIYIRNLQLKQSWSVFPLFIRAILFSLPIIAWGWIFTNSADLHLLFSSDALINGWVMIGTLGLFMLNLRYLYQWYYSEKEKESVLPFGFWVISAVASIFVVAYAIHRFDPVLFFSQGLGLLVYLRNIFLQKKRSV
jgi:lipid-A-disaccharide synthase-like uncharacterized protein